MQGGRRNWTLTNWTLTCNAEGCRNWTLTYMAYTSRTAKSLQNVKVALIFYFLNLLLQFFSRKIFLDYLGSEVLGLNTTAQNLLGFLNLAELGIGAAVAYNLYRPLFEGDRKVINDIVSIQGWLYRKIAWVVIGGAILLMCFFPFLFAKAQVPLWYAYGSFLALLVSALLGYFVNYRQIVLSADQKEYRITCSVQGVKIVKVILQLLAIRYLNHGYIWWMALEVIMAFVTSYVLNWNIRKEYPWLRASPRQGAALRKQYPGIITKTKQIFFHKIGGFVLTQTSPLIIYAYASLTLVAIYGNYMLIVAGVTTLVNALLNSISAGVGNLVAEGNKERIKSVFWELTVLRMWIASVICFGMYMLGHSFISLWVGPEYILPQTAYIVLTAITFIGLSRTNDAFISAYGLYQDIWAPVAESSLNLGLSILFGYYYGLTGILSGVLISQLVIIYSWKPYFLYRKGFKDKFGEYVWCYVKYLSLLLIAWIVSICIIDNYMGMQLDNYIQWCISGILTISIYAIISVLLLNIFDLSSRCIFRRVLKMR